MTMEKKGPRVSIIVPVYNAQKYLERCVDSILEQDYKDFELLLMDDGSTDGSGKICDSYAERDRRVRVVHKKNSGVSDTRNQALSLAEGELIQFLDSDDWIVPEATRLLVRSMEEYGCDMVISDFYRVSGERLAQKGDIEEDRVMTRQEFAACMVENPADFYYGVLWNKMYRRSIIEKYQIRMDTSLSWCEDFLFNLEYIRHAESFYALQVPIYYYLKRKGSLVSQGASINNTMRMKINIFEYYNEFYKDVYDHEDYANIRLQVYSFLWSAAKDGGVPMALLPGSKKLGQERRQITRREVEGEGAVIGQYRVRRLYEYELEIAAKKNNMSLDEAMLLCAISQCPDCDSVRQLGNLTGIGQPRLFLGLQKLERRKLIKTGKDKTAKDRLHFTLTPEADRVCRDFVQVEKDLEMVCREGFSDDEWERCRQFKARMDENMIRFMVKEVPEEEDGE
ncbi:MAG: glycosyltransferase [Eubacteriales bacterium]|nr:glycosyltransferase [Eubacteriales bacterium]